MTGQFFKYFTISLMLVSVSLISKVEAQTKQTGRFILGGNLGIQTADNWKMNTRTDSLNFDLFAETGRLASKQDLGPGPVFDVSFSMGIWGKLGIGTTVSYFKNESSATIIAQVPHPFFFEFPRTAIGSANDITHEELAVHLQVHYRIPLSDNLSLLLFVGPTLFEAKQELVDTITTTERGFPFNKVDIVSNTSQMISLSENGYNLGFDLTYFIFNRFGTSFMLRYSRAAPSIYFAEESQSRLELGGVQVVGGIRLAF